MTISLIENTIKVEIEKIRPPESIRDKMDIDYTFENNVLEIFEISPDFRDATQKMKMPVAKTRYYKSQDIWKIYWMRGTGKWELYEVSEVKTIRAFFKILEKDQHGCFFG